MAFFNALVGQNGFLTAALIGGALYLIPIRPVLAGICLGLLTYKPQYGLLFPIALIAAGHWRVFVSASVTAIAMVFVSWLAFGTESWLAFFHWMPRFSQAFLTEGKATWWKLQSIFSMVRYFGGTEQLAWAFQWVLTASVAVVLALMWRSRVPYTLKAAALAAGTLLTTPYLFMYDMMVLAIAVAFLVRIGLKTGFRALRTPGAGRRARSDWLLHLHGHADGARRHADRLGPHPAAAPVRGGGASRRQPWLRPAPRRRLRSPGLPLSSLPLPSRRPCKTILSSAVNRCSLLQGDKRSFRSKC